MLDMKWENYQHNQQRNVLVPAKTMICVVSLLGQRRRRSVSWNLLLEKGKEKKVPIQEVLIVVEHKVIIYQWKKFKVSQQTVT